MQIVVSDSRAVAAFRPRFDQSSALESLREHALASCFVAWRGGSGRRYICTVYSIDHGDPAADLPTMGPGILLAVRRRDTRRHCIGAVALERGGDWTAAVARLHGGADEWHVHLLAPDRVARRATCADLHAGLDIAPTLAGAA